MKKLTDEEAERFGYLTGWAPGGPNPHTADEHLQSLARHGFEVVARSFVDETEARSTVGRPVVDYSFAIELIGRALGHHQELHKPKSVVNVLAALFDEMPDRVAADLLAAVVRGLDLEAMKTEKA